MNKEFIPYEQALELKELGFDEPCLFAFDNCSTPMRCSDLRTSKQKFNGVNYNSSSYTSQPTFSQAFRWFRDKNKLHAVVDINISNEWYFSIFNLDAKRNAEVVKKDEYYNTYEEAELACLKELIKLSKKI